VRDGQEVKEQLNHISMVNESEFEYNYLKLQQHSEKVIKLEVVENYISSKFKWNKVKAKYFLEKNNITSLQELLEYSPLPFFEKSILSKTQSFLLFCQNAAGTAENSN
jgi:hypothetical protein